MTAAILANKRLLATLQLMADAGIESAADGLSQMIGRRVIMTVPKVTTLPFCEVPARVGGAEVPVVGIYLACNGDLGGHIMLILQQEEALRLVDLLLDQPEGVAVEFDPLARSALAEAGNLAVSFFLNAIATVMGISSRPSPPAVIVDMAGAILDIMLVVAGEFGDEVLLLETMFRDADRHIKLLFWMLPDLLPLQDLVWGRG